MISFDWIFRYDGPRPGREQMDLDRALFESCSEGRSGPVFRLYSWHPPAISLGAHQNPGRDVDGPAAAARGVDIVVRPTGGRAIYHDEELTYAVIAGVDDPHFGGSIAVSHAAISRVFSRALARLGIDAEMGAPLGSGPAEPTEGRSPAGRAWADESRKSPCFASATRTELTVGGRKILGSAQRRSLRAFLQHGSLLLGDAHLDLVSFLPVSLDTRRRLRLELTRKTTTVTHEAGRVVPLRELIDAVAAALSEQMDRPGLRFTQQHDF